MAWQTAHIRSLLLSGVLVVGLPAAALGEPLLDAASRGDATAVRAQLAAGASLESRDARGWTPLMLAAALGHASVVQILLEEGADPNSQATDGSTPLIGAAVGGHMKVVELLLAGGANPALANRVGSTARIKAQEYGHLEIAARLDRAQATPGLRRPSEAEPPQQEAPPPETSGDAAIEAFDAVYLLVTDATFRRLPSDTAGAAGQLPAGFAIKVTGKVRGADWYRVGPPEIAVWVSGQSIRPSGGTAPK